MKGSASSIFISSGVMPQRNLMMPLWPPIGLADPQDLARGHAPEVAIDVDVLAVDHRANADLRAGSLGALVDASAGRNVRVLVEDAGRDVLALGVNPGQFRDVLAEDGPDRTSARRP